METGILLWLSFLAGVYAPVGSPCVLVLYPGYLAFLAGAGENDPARAPAFISGLVVAAGVIVSLLLGGMLFSVALQASGAAARLIFGPVASALLLAFALALILDIPLPARAGTLPVTPGRRPFVSAFLLGLFLGILILPCNAAVILVLLTLAASAATAAAAAGCFLAFGTGMVLPLIVLAAVPRSISRRATGFLARHRPGVQRAAGLAMLAIAVWYLAGYLLPGSAGSP